MHNLEVHWGGGLLCIPPAPEAAKRNQLSATKPFLPPPSGLLINRLFPGCKTAGFLKLVWKQEILKCGFLKLVLKQELLRAGSVAFLQQYPVCFLSEGILICTMERTYQ